MPTVLIADNIEAACQAVAWGLSRELEKTGPSSENWAICKAATPDEAIELIQRSLHTPSRVDILLADLNFTEVPGREGIRLIEEAKKVDPQIVAILYTGATELSEEQRAEAVEHGAFDAATKRTSDRELLIKFNAALNHRQLLRQLDALRRYFDPRVLDYIQHNPAVLTARQRLVTICFWDIRKFSKLCECLITHPDSVVDFLKDYFEEAARTIFEHRGVLDKFMGDGVMALFGVLDDKTDDGVSDALDAVRAAFQLRTRFGDVFAKWEPQWRRETSEELPPEFGLGCGIHTARVLVGSVGTGLRDQFTALGRDVNRTARVQSRAKKGQVLLSQTTEARLRGRVNVVPFGLIEGKPGETPIVAYEATGLVV